MAGSDVTRIASNIGALNALNSLQNINKQLSIHQSRLQSGKRINSAADDPAGYTIATKMLARSEGLKVALNNIGDANNMLSVAEAGMSKMNDILVQMRGKAEQAASDTLGATERQAIQTQLSAYSEQIDNIVNETKWNGVKLLDGSVDKRFQTGVDDGEYTTWKMSQNHTAGSAGLNISSAVTGNTLNSQTISTGITDFDAVTNPNTGMTSLAAGSYNVVGVYATTASSEIVSNGSIPVASGTTGIVWGLTAGPGAELGNGAHTVEITALGATLGAGQDLKYKIDGGNEQTITLNRTTATNATNVVDLKIGANTIGISLTINNSAAAGVATQKGVQTAVNFEYMQANTVKSQLQTADGVGVLVADETNTAQTAQYMYTVGSETINTGRGVSIDFDDYNSLTSGGVTGAAHKATFNFAPTNAYSVDVSTASIASAYMKTVSSAMDTVNNSMASLGSLMARLTFKEDQISTAQVNVESSYSRIMNANMAEEQVNASKFTILQQTATAMLAQANQAPQSLLSLFR